MCCNEILICHCDPNVRENNAGTTRIFSIIPTNVTSVLDRIQTLFVREFDESESVYASESDFG